MILQIFRVHLLRLWHSKSDLVLTFVVPLAFFSVFAIIFGNRSGSRSTPKIRVALSDSAKTLIPSQRSNNSCSRRR